MLSISLGAGKCGFATGEDHPSKSEAIDMMTGGGLQPGKQPRGTIVQQHLQQGNPEFSKDRVFAAHGLRAYLYRDVMHYGARLLVLCTT